jgi:small subunit ribosomal protein S21
LSSKNRRCESVREIFKTGCVFSEERLTFAARFLGNKFFHQNKEKFMLIVEVKDGEAIDKVLKKYKRKFERAGILKELRRRKAFSKPSVQRRAEVLKAVYKEETYGNKND